MMLEVNLVGTAITLVRWRLSSHSAPSVMLGPRQILLASFRTDGHCSHLAFSKRKENRMTEREQRRLVNQRLAAVQHAEG